ncbi:EAL domain-containing protein [Oceanimonas sp. CAM02]|uniref:EAL domain-containing protein n=1 Tax=Oceanimonas sp. CAM02 TaxID=3080336 RepID=UPI0029362CFD|nr:EAL domain-containing protein [Oceanimonas sp. CAM02]MDV2859077.1 EAL domain-containing protein [Oceanimonas sp. CAM02]
MKRLFIPVPGTDPLGASHSVKRALIVLLALCMLLFGLGAAYSLQNIRQHSTLLEQRNYELPWSLMQLKLEMNRFLDGVRLLHAGAISHDELMLRYDILWSRTPVLLSQQLKDTLTDRPDLWQLIQQIEDRVRGMEPLVKAIRPGEPGYQLLLAELSPYAEPLARTMTATMHSNVLFYAEYDQAYRELGRQLYICIVSLAVCGVLLLFMLAMELWGYRKRLLHDPLTGLPNRFSLHYRLEHLIARQRPFSLTLIELEEVARIRQQFGFEVADRLQQILAQRLRQCLLSGEHLSAYGRDGLIVTTEGMLELAEIRAQLTRIRQKLITAENISGHDFYPTPQIGVVLYPADADNMVDLLARVELALELCRRDQLPYVIFDSSLLKDAERRQQLARDLPAALASDSLTLQFYPLVTPSGECAGLRLSLQWRHPRFGEVAGSELQRMTEQYQLSERLLLWAVCRLAERLPEWRMFNSALFISLPLPLSVLRASLSERLTNLLERHGLGGDALIMELTEAELQQAGQQAEAVLTALQQQGIRVMLTEFGSGCSQWGQLVQLPLSWLQLDAFWCSGIEQRAGAREQLTRLFELARVLKLPVLCCGISSAAEAGLVTTMEGCTLLQGPYVSPSLEAMEVREWLEHRGGPARLTDFELSPDA